MKKIHLLSAIIAMALCSCGANPPESNNNNNGKNENAPALSPEKIEVLFEDSVQVTSLNCDITRWEIKNDYVAIVDEKGLIEGLHVGTTTLTAYYTLENTEYSLTAEVIVKGKSELFKDPILDFSMTNKDIEKTLGTPTQDLTSDAYQTLVYGDINKDSYITCYDFFNDKLIEVRICLANEEMVEELEDFLSERYEMDEEEEMIIVFIDAYEKKDATINVTFRIDNVFGQRVLTVSYKPAE